MKYICKYLYAILFSITLSGCSAMGVGAAKQVDGIEGKKMSDGTWYLYDTPSHWAEFQRIMDMHIEAERSGSILSGGYRNWNEFWNARLRALDPKKQEHSAKYISYIVESRRKAGLPELVGYP